MHLVPPARLMLRLLECLRIYLLIHPSIRSSIQLPVLCSQNTLHVTVPPASWVPLVP